MSFKTGKGTKLGSMVMLVQGAMKCNIQRNIRSLAPTKCSPLTLPSVKATLSLQVMLRHYNNIDLVGETVKRQKSGYSLVRS